MISLSIKGMTVVVHMLAGLGLLYALQLSGVIGNWVGNI